MSNPNEYMAVATYGGDVIRRRAVASSVGERGLGGTFQPIMHRTPELRSNELLVERLGMMPMIIRAHA